MRRIEAVQRTMPSNAWALRQTMSFQVQPKRLNPSFTMSIACIQTLNKRIKTGKLIFLIAGLVEPDGIEPTTSCLQSTRSTN